MSTQNHMMGDQELFPDFVEALADHIPAIERDVTALKHNPDDRASIADLFRSVHSIKGDATLCRLDQIVRLAHPLESLLSRLREGEVRFSDLLGETILLATDRLELTVQNIADGRPTSHLQLSELIGGLQRLAEVPADTVEKTAAILIESVTGFRPSATASTHIAVAPSFRTAEDSAADLQFFHRLALQLENRSPLFTGRSQRLLRLAQATNLEAGQPADPMQLEAAVYFHDIGMMFLLEGAWLGNRKLSDTERNALHAHPDWAAGLLERIPGWQEAAIMVAQHHEMPDGKGYPHGLGEDAICPGAKILAIVDAFEAVTLKHSASGQRRSLLRAIAEINACENQFASEWVAPFNAVVRRMIEG